MHLHFFLCTLFFTLPVVTSFAGVLFFAKKSVVQSESLSPNGTFSDVGLN